MAGADLLPFAIPLLEQRELRRARTGWRGEAEVAEGLRGEQPAARRTLELAEELQQKALATAGIHHAPGC